MEVIIKSREDEIASQAVEEYDIALEFRHNRLLDWNKNYELYSVKKVEGLKNRANVCLPIMSGFVDTLQSKIDEPPAINFEKTEEADHKLVKKVNALYQVDSAQNHGNWKWKDILAKKDAIFCGRAIFKYYADSIKDKYRSHLVRIDPYDFLYDPWGGGEDMENARFMGQEGIFLDKYELQRQRYGIQPSRIAKLIDSSTDEVRHKNEADNKYNERVARFQLMGINIENTKLFKVYGYNLTEWVTTFKGKRYVLLMDMRTGVWLSVKPLKTVFTTIDEYTEEALWPYGSFAPKTDGYNFWSVAPADDVREINYTANVLINQALDNRQKVNFNMRAYDIKLFKDPKMLRYRPDGLVPASSADGNIRNGIYEFETKELAIRGSIDMISFLDQMTGRATGVTADAQGASEEDKVGIYFGNMQQVADRLGLYNKSYENMYIKLGKLYFNGLCEHLIDERAVRILGEKGVEWETLTNDEIKDKNLDIIIKGGSQEVRLEEVSKKKKLDFLTRNIQNMLLNQEWRLKEEMHMSGYDDSDIKTAMDQTSQEDLDILAEAAQENQDMFAGKDVKPNKDATAGHVQKHKDFAEKNELTDEQFMRIMEHANAEIPIAVENMAKRAHGQMAKQGILNTPKDTEGNPEMGMVENIANNEVVEPPVAENTSQNV